MKLTQSTKRKAGMTLLELTVVILVLLSLISILFVGARAWKKGSDRAANILNIRNMQQAARSHANMNQLNIGDALVSTDLIGTNKYFENSPKHPVAGSTYGFESTVPVIGTLYMKTTALGTGSPFADITEIDPKVADTRDW